MIKEKDMFAFVESPMRGQFFVIIRDNVKNGLYETVTLPNLDNLLVSYDDMDNFLNEEIAERVDEVPENVFVYLVNEFEKNSEKYIRLLEKWDEYNHRCE